MRITPHVAQNEFGYGGSAVDARTTRPAGYRLSQRKRKLVERAFGWLKTVELFANFSTLLKADRGVSAEDGHRRDYPVALGSRYQPRQVPVLKTSTWRDCCQSPSLLFGNDDPVV